MIIKVCKKHGELHESDVIKSGKNQTGSIRYKCRACMKILHADNYQRNKEKIIEKNKRNKIDNYEKYLEIKRNYARKYREKNKESERLRVRQYEGTPKRMMQKCFAKRKKIRELHPTYIKDLLCRRFGFHPDTITYELVEVKRIIIEIKRIQRERKLNGQL